MLFTDFIASLGITPPDSFTPGKWQRTSSTANSKKKTCNVKLCDDETAGFAIDFANMTEAAVWRLGDDKRAERSAEENAALSARLALRREEEIRGTMRAVTAYDNATALLHANHEYCRKKSMTMEGLRGIRVDRDGWLVIPVNRDNRLISVQRISGEGDKRFFPGAPTKGGSYRIWRPGAVVTILCEGLATGCAVFSAVQTAQVIVCFSAANLVAVAEREDWSGMVAVAGDNDQWTEETHGKNPGREAAMKAAKLIGCGYAVPICDGTDWDDFARERLAILSKSEEGKSYGMSPHKLRQSALMPIRTAIMAAVLKINVK